MESFFFFQLPSLFDGCRFYLHGEFGQGGQHPVPTRDELTQLVRLGGGTMLSREPRLELYNQLEMTVPYHADPNSALADCSFFVVSSSERDVVVCGKGRRLCRVPPAWVLASAAEFRLIDKLPAV
jgi:BRCT domain, a BRCA1 C-terminus domain